MGLDDDERQAKAEVNLTRRILEDCINDYMDIIVEVEGFTVKEAQKWTSRDCKIFIKRYEE